MPKQKRKKQPEDKENAAPIQRGALPDSNEEHASVVVINKWVALGDTALSVIAGLEKWRDVA
jgi:hypothetical protein